MVYAAARGVTVTLPMFKHPLGQSAFELFLGASGGILIEHDNLIHYFGGKNRSLLPEWSLSRYMQGKSRIRSCLDT